MAPPPPSSQQGKFKPRRPTPQRRSNEAGGGGDGQQASVQAPAGGTAGGGNTQAPGSNNSSNTGNNHHVAFAPGTAPGPPPHEGRPHHNHRGRGRGRGRGGGRHGGRGGRGAGRQPMPRGEVFFTSDMSGGQGQSTSGATASSRTSSSASASTNTIRPGVSRVAVGSSRDATAASSSNSDQILPPPVLSSSSTRSLAEERRRNKAAMDMPEEEIVGIMETGVGGLRGDENNAGYEGDAMDYIDDGGSSTRTRQSANKTATVDSSDLDMYGLLYDSSDSSDDDDDDRAKGAVEIDDDDDVIGGDYGDGRRLRPMELPFPTKRQAWTDTQSLPVSVSSSSHTLPTNMQQHMFSDPHSWMLIQLPTRLPQLKQQHAASGSSGVRTSNSNTHAASSVVPDQATSSSQVIGSLPAESDSTSNNNYYSEVVTPPVNTHAFDNQLQNAAPGRLGKIQVYASGKMVLVMDDPNGGPEVSYKSVD